MGEYDDTIDLCPEKRVLVRLIHNATVVQHGEPIDVHPSPGEKQVQRAMNAKLLVLMGKTIRA